MATKVRDRIYVKDSQYETYRQLTGIGEGKKKTKEATGGDSAPFRALKDVFMLSFCVGLKSGRGRTPLGKNRHELIFVNALNDQDDMTVLKGTAIAETGDIMILEDQNQIYTIAEEYANTGFVELSRKLMERGRPLVNLVDLLMDEYKELIAEAETE